MRNNTNDIDIHGHINESDQFINRPQRSVLAQRDIFGAAWLNLQKGPTNSSYILWLISDALSDEEVWKAYLWELWDHNASLTTTRQTLQWSKKTFDTTLYNNLLSSKLEQVFDECIEEFCLFIDSKIQKHTHTIENYIVVEKNLKEKQKKKTTLAIQKDNPQIDSLKSEISNIKKNIKKLDPKLNSASITKRQDKIITIENQIKQLSNKTIENLDTQDTNLQNTTNSITEEKRILQELQKILQWRDKKSSTFFSIKKEFIDTHALKDIALSRVQNIMYSEKEMSYKDTIKKWFLTVLEKHKLKNKHKWNTKQYTHQKVQTLKPSKRELEYKSAVKASINMLEKIDMKEHIISTICELLQIELLEKELQKTYPHYNIAVKKAPIIDDIRSNTDCIIEISWWNIPKNEILYHAVDLKTSANDMYIVEEKDHLWSHTYLPGTAHVLWIDTMRTHNSIVQILPSITYATFCNLLSHLWEGKKTLSGVDQELFTKVHNALAINYNKQNLSIQYNDSIMSLRPQMRSIIENLGIAV